MTTYKITKMYAPHINKPNKTIMTGLSLEEAREHCQDPKTKKEGEWFDGYDKE